jgi:hypothetical protein
MQTRNKGFYQPGQYKLKHQKINARQINKTKSTKIRTKQIANILNFNIHKFLGKKSDEFYRVSVHITQSQYQYFKQHLTGRFRPNNQLINQLELIKYRKLDGNRTQRLDKPLFRLHKKKTIFDENNKIIIEGPCILSIKFGVTI